MVAGGWISVDKLDSVELLVLGQTTWEQAELWFAREFDQILSLITWIWQNINSQFLHVFISENFCGNQKKKQDEYLESGHLWLLWRQWDLYVIRAQYYVFVVKEIIILYCRLFGILVSPLPGLSECQEPQHFCLGLCLPRLFEPLSCHPLFEAHPLLEPLQSHPRRGPTLHHKGEIQHCGRS